MMNKIKSLYIHIPFCDHICSYCDFYKMLSNNDTVSKYIQYLEKELILKKQYLNDIEHIFIGGGTPSSIGAHNLQFLFDSLKKHLDFTQIVEFSIECNPKDITNELVSLFKQNGVNRISLGIQSLNNKKLKLLNRNHNKKDVLNALKIIKNNNFHNYNVDIMYGLPGDSFKLVRKDINILKKFKNTHFSCYSLILEERTILYNKYLKGDFKPFNEDKEAKLYYKIQKFLEKNKYMQYETSNFCIQGHECLYNLNTWKNQKYLGIGTSASYYIDNKRFTNIRNIKKYFNFLDNKEENLYIEEYEIDTETMMFEEIMLGLRLNEGVNILKFEEKYNFNIFKKFPNINFLINNNLLEHKNDKIYIPKNKMYISNSIINKILE